MSEPQTTPAARRERPPPARVLPSEEEIAGWIGGEEVPSLAALFDQRTVKTFDVLVMQIKKEELLPQHWQVIAATEAPAGEVFDALPEAARLRRHYGDEELARRRLAALRLAWRELRGKRPSLWTVADLFAALRRIYEQGHEVDHYDLLTAVRDLWRTSPLPAGQQQLNVLWSCLVLTRQKTKK